MSPLVLPFLDISRPMRPLRVLDRVYSPENREQPFEITYKFSPRFSGEPLHFVRGFSGAPQIPAQGSLENRSLKPGKPA